MRAELDAMKAENARLAEQRRSPSLAAVRQTLTGRVPGRAVEALVELAEAADKAAGGKALASSMPTSSMPTSSGHIFPGRTSPGQTSTGRISKGRISRRPG